MDRLRRLGAINRTDASQRQGERRWDGASTAPRRRSGSNTGVVLAGCLALTVAAGAVGGVVLSDGSGRPAWCQEVTARRAELEAGSVAAWRTLRGHLPASDQPDADAVVEALEDWQSASTTPLSFANATQLTAGLGESLPRLQGHFTKSCAADLPAPLLAPTTPTASQGKQ